MEPDSKKKFNFGTGEIDVDQWLKDIDAGLSGYYADVDKTYHKLEAAAIRKAMSNLVGRISNGDMMSRSANGTYNFKSQLYSPNRDKYDKWAHLIALNYIGNKGRALLSTPKEEKTEEKTEGSKKSKYSTLSLIKRFNNSVLRGSTALNLDNTWWGTADLATRASHLALFLNKEAAYLRGTDVDDVDEAYQDLGKEGLASAMATLAALITANPDGDYGRQFGNLGITNLLRRTTNAATSNQAVQQPLTVDEQITQYQLAEQDAKKQIQLGWYQNRGADTYYNNGYADFFDNAVNVLNTIHSDRKNGLDVQRLTQSRLPIDALGAVISDVVKADLNYKLHFIDTNASVSLFLERLKENWESLFTPNSEGLKYKDGENEFTMPPQLIWKGLALLTYTMPTSDTERTFVYTDDRQKPIKVGNDLLYIPGTYRKTGDILLFDTYNKRLVKSNILKYPTLGETLGNALFEKEGGVLKLQGGNYIPPAAAIAYNSRQATPSAPTQAVTLQPTQNLTTTGFSRQKLTPGDITRLSSMGADLLSLATSFGRGRALSKFSRWASVGAGVGNLVGDAMNYGSGDGARAPMAGAWFGHDLADLGIRIYGATPFGNRGVALRALSQQLSRNFMLYGRALAPFVLATLNNQDAAKSLMQKATSGRFNELNTDEWMTLATALEGLMSGKAIQVHTQRARAADNAITHYNVTKPDGTTLTMTKLEYMGDRKAFGILPSSTNGRGVPVRTQKGLVDNNKFTVRDGYYQWVGSWVLPWALPNRINKTSLRWFNMYTEPEEGYVRKWNPSLNGGEGDFEPTDMSKMIIGPVREAPLRQSSSVLRDLRLGPVNWESAPEDFRPRRTRVSLDSEQEETGPIIIGSPEPEVKPAVVGESEGPIIIGNPEPEIQVPLRPQEPPVQAGPLGRLKKNRGKKRKHELGGYFKFLRTGGIVKYDGGGKTGINAGEGYNWYNNVFSGYRLHILDGLGTEGYVDWLNTMQGSHASIYNAAGGSTNSWRGKAYENESVKNYQTLYQTGFNGYDTNNPYNTTGIGKAYNTQGHYDFSGSNKRGTLEVNQGLFRGSPDGLYSQMTDDRRLLGRKGDWTPELLEEWLTALKAKGFKMELDPNDRYYRILPIDNSKQNVDPNVEGEQKPEAVKPEDAETERTPGQLPKAELKKPWDPRALLIGVRAATNILSNDWMFDRMLDRLPLWYSRDFIDRKLDTIGDYAAIANAGNLSADLRTIQRLRLVSDLSLNLAADFESGRIGREIDDKARLLDANKQAVTHEAAVQLDMKDLEDARDTAFINRRLMHEYLSDRFDIQNAKDKARVDATVGAVDNLTSLYAGKYLEKKAVYDEATKSMMQTPKEYAIEQMEALHPELYKAISTGDYTPEQLAEYQRLMAEYSKVGRERYYQQYYSLYGGRVRTPDKLHGIKEKDLALNKKGGKLEFIKSLRQ